MTIQLFMKTYRRWIATVATIILAAPSIALAAPFTLSAKGMADNDMLPVDAGFDKMSGDGSRQCGGKNIAPGFAWSNPPSGTQSFALLMFDPDGRRGLGVSHWVLYNVPADVQSLSTADVAANKYTVGLRANGKAAYEGPCPPLGDAPHHYMLTIYALDLPPTLAAGLDRDALLKAMTDHIKGATSVIMRYQAP
jgi:Raf kinase inhibitor-like YbhB/YbcL family protein